LRTATCLLGVLLCGCAPFDPDLLSRSALRDRLRADPLLEELMWDETIEDTDDWHHERLAGSVVFGVPQRTDHKLYTLWSVSWMPPAAIVVAVSRSTRRALVLTGSPENFGRLLALEGISCEGGWRTEMLMDEFLTLTNLPAVNFYALDSADDIPEEAYTHPWAHVPPRETLEGLIRPLEISRAPGGGYEGTRCILSPSGLMRRRIRVSADGRWSFEDTPIRYPGNHWE
jgi:hypothetical protein